jgi:small subunit ribosomal protein S6
MILAEKRVYEVVFIVDPDTQDEEITRLSENLSGIVTDQGGVVTRNEVLGRRQLAYRIGRRNEGVYVLFEIEGTGHEIAELERRMRVNDQVMRYLTVRVDEERQRAEKFKAKRAKKAAKRPFAAAAAGGAPSRPGSRGGEGNES